MLVKRSVTRSLAKALIAIVALSVLSTGLALTTVADSLRDAEAVNIAGSLRMQSYRLAYDLTQNNAALPQHLRHYRQSLQAPALQKLSRFYVPADVRDKYRALQQAWQPLEQHIRAGRAQAYQASVVSYVNQIDHFVLALQRYSEIKLAIVAAFSVLGYVVIIALVLFCIRLMRRQVVAPLRQLVDASQQIQRRDFNHTPLDVTLPNELGVLSQAFTAMSGELSRLYHSLEHKVQEKTERLQQANKTLEVMYSCSQALSSGQIDRHAFEKVLHIVRQSEQLQCLQLGVQDGQHRWQLCSGSPQEGAEWQRLTIMQEQHSLGQLCWQARQQAANPHLMQSVANMLGRGLYFQPYAKAAYAVFADGGARHHRPRAARLAGAGAGIFAHSDDAAETHAGRQPAADADDYRRLRSGAGRRQPSAARTAGHVPSEHSGRRPEHRAAAAAGAIKSSNPGADSVTL